MTQAFEKPKPHRIFYFGVYADYWGKLNWENSDEECETAPS